MGETKRGRLGVSSLTAATNTAVYDATASMDSMVDVLFVNTGVSHAKIRLAVVNGAVGDTATEDYIQYDTPLLQGGTLRINDINVAVDEIIVAYANVAGVVCRVEGVEQDQAGGSTLREVMVLSSGTLAVTAFEDVGNTTGYKDFAAQLPAGAIPLGWKATVTGAFKGDTSAVVQVGIAGDLDRFSADTAGSVFAAGTVGSLALAADGSKSIAAAVTPRVTVTTASDFSTCKTDATGVMTVELYYIKTV